MLLAVEIASASKLSGSNRECNAFCRSGNSRKGRWFEKKCTHFILPNTCIMLCMGSLKRVHDQYGSPARLLIDEAKSVRDEILDTLERCHTTFRLFLSSTGQAAGGFYRIMTAKAHLWKRSGCPQVTVPTSARPRSRPIARISKTAYSGLNTAPSGSPMRAIR